MRLSRRRFLTISAAACATAASAGAAPVATWRGAALGARASMQLVGVSRAEAAPIFRAMAQEISRLEAIFSLYRPDSAISRLNRDGALSAPPAELLQLCALSTALHRATKGAFDPTIQPLWSLVARDAAHNVATANADIAKTHALTGWHDVSYASARIAFGRPGMAITLNGIAQGFITDRIADTLRGFGLTDVLIDMGEIRALGTSPDGTPWRVGFAEPGGDCCLGRITLSDRALATSAPLGTVMDAAGELGHILDPATGRSASGVRQVSVSAPRADIADGLSTALCAADPSHFGVALAEFPGAKVEHRVT